MLFEIDEVLNSSTHGNFVRWMDDINIGIDSKDDAFAILGNVNDMLKSRGLALNISKTKVYTADEAKKHFMVDENSYLDKVNKTDPAAPQFAKIKAEFLRRFRSHIKKFDLENWDKVTKRYFTVASHLKINELRNYSYQLFLGNPSVRTNILSFLGRLKFSKGTANIILDLLRDVKRYDDVTLFNLCRTITNMEIPRTKTGTEFIKSVDKALSPVKSDFDLYCYLWFLAKYGEPYKLMNPIENTKKRWRSEQFLARQVVSVLPRLIHFREQAVNRLINEQSNLGPSDAASVATNIRLLLTKEKVVRDLYAYLFPAKGQRPYPLPK